jgi:DNA-binding HxlR family transcriptional regulator
MQLKSGDDEPSAAAPALWMIRANIVHRVTDIVGDTWTLRLVGRLLHADARFDELVQALEIPRSTLDARLRALADHGCVRRPQAQGDSYGLTPQGRGLLVLLRQMQQWDAQGGLQGRVLEGLRALNPCGHDAPLHLRCGHCHQPVAARAMKVLQTHRQPSPAPGLPHKRVRVLQPDDTESPLPAEQLMGDRWMGLILGAAFFRAQRFSDIAAALGIAPNMLVARLGRLLQQGLLARVPYGAGGERHAYRLTPRGLAYYPVITAAIDWGRRWLDPQDDPGWRVLHRDCLEWFEPEFVCGECGAAA